ncbi:MAG: DUF72 domain-containing protein [Chloroflexi bacterium]|nr:DUF72 domain-containing protein [Chloroflexota bacterium]
MTARAFVGASGWSYATWIPKFYPPGTKARGMLQHYGTRLATTEVNYTFNHLPTDATVAGWLAATAPGFTFALKASQRITHFDRLAHPADTLPLFLERARLLGDRLGPLFFQTPPWLKRDDDLLAGFVASLPADIRCALEVRNASWYVPETYEILALRGLALVHAEGESAPSPIDTLDRTAPFVYVRLRKDEGYTEAEIAGWAERLRGHLAAGRDVYAYLKHDDDGSNGLWAERLRDLIAA